MNNWVTKESKHYIFNYHEDSHILSYLISTPPQVFIREGLAMYFDKNHRGISNTNWVSYFIYSDKYIHILNLMCNEEFYKSPWNITYPIAGAFTNYLITIYGVDKYLMFYKDIDDDFNLSFYNTFGISIYEFEIEFIKYIKSLDISNELCELLEALMNK